WHERPRALAHLLCRRHGRPREPESRPLRDRLRAGARLSPRASGMAPRARAAVALRPCVALPRGSQAWRQGGARVLLQSEPRRLALSRRARRSARSLTLGRRRRAGGRGRRGRPGPPRPRARRRPARGGRRRGGRTFRLLPLVEPRPLHPIRHRGGARMIRILDPTLAAAPTPTTMPRAPRPAVLRGATLGLLANGKSNGMALLDRIAEHLCERHGV